ncbi:MAG: ImmA/IrrE family metallo-endopeptidase [Betaproteobacteria bacterium]
MKSPLARQAKRILTELGITEIPIPVEKIAEKLGAKLSYEPFEGQEDISGVLYRKDSHVVIGINSTHVKARQRFSIAHEIGHLVMHKGALFVDKTVRFNRDANSSKAVDPREIQANQFAAELLMPEELVANEVSKRLKKKGKYSQQLLVEELATTFGVSAQSMEFRLINLGIL